MHEELQRLGNHDLLGRCTASPRMSARRQRRWWRIWRRSSGAERDGMRCTFVSDDGHRCEARQRLQYHHDRAYALGGQASADNIRLLCQPHNLLMAERDFGPLFTAAKSSSRDQLRD